MTLPWTTFSILPIVSRMPHWRFFGWFGHIYPKVSFVTKSRRQYLKCLNLHFDRDLERAIDYFLPHLPSLKIHKGAIHRLIKSYESALAEFNHWVFKYVLAVKGPFNHPSVWHIADSYDLINRSIAPLSTSTPSVRHDDSPNQVTNWARAFATSSRTNHAYAIAHVHVDFRRLRNECTRKSI